MTSTSPGTGGAAARPGLLLAIDQGTTNTKAALVDPTTGEIVTSFSRPLGISFPAAGAVEQDAEELWAATLGAVEGCLAAMPGATCLGIAIANQRESVVAWNRRSGEAIALSTPTNRDSGMVLKPVVGSPMRVRRLILTERDNPFAEHLDKLGRFTADVLTETLERQPVYHAWRERHGALPDGPRPRT